MKDQSKAKGGRARADALTPKKRSEIASRAAKARYAAIQATHGSPDHPLRIGDVEIPCYVLEDGTRVFSQRGLQTGIGMSISGGSFGEQRMAGFVDGLAQKGVDIKDLSARIRNPIRFRISSKKLTFSRRSGRNSSNAPNRCCTFARQIP